LIRLCARVPAGVAGRGVVTGQGVLIALVLGWRRASWCCQRWAGRAARDGCIGPAAAQAAGAASWATAGQPSRGL